MQTSPASRCVVCVPPATATRLGPRSEPSSPSAGNPCRLSAPCGSVGPHPTQSANSSGAKAAIHLILDHIPPSQPTAAAGPRPQYILYWTTPTQSLNNSSGAKAAIHLILDHIPPNLSTTAVGPRLQYILYWTTPHPVSQQQQWGQGRNTSYTGPHPTQSANNSSGAKAAIHLILDHTHPISQQQQWGQGRNTSYTGPHPTQSANNSSGAKAAIHLILDHIPPNLSTTAVGPRLQYILYWTTSHPISQQQQWGQGRNTSYTGPHPTQSANSSGAKATIHLILDHTPPNLSTTAVGPRPQYILYWTTPTQSLNNSSGAKAAIHLILDHIPPNLSTTAVGPRLQYILILDLTPPSQPTAVGPRQQYILYWTSPHPVSQQQQWGQGRNTSYTGPHPSNLSTTAVGPRLQYILYWTTSHPISQQQQWGQGRNTSYTGPHPTQSLNNSSGAKAAIHLILDHTPPSQPTAVGPRQQYILYWTTPHPVSQQQQRGQGHNTSYTGPHPTQSANNSSGAKATIHLILDHTPPSQPTTVGPRLQYILYWL